jgi:hypothetical protein
LTALVWDDKAAPIIAARITPSWFPARLHQIIAAAAVEFAQKYCTAAGAHIGDLLDAHLADRENGAVLRDILADMKELAPKLNPEYVLDGLDHFIRQQQMRVPTEAAADAIHEGNLDEARSHLWQAIAVAPPAPALSDPWAELVAPPFDPDILPRVLRNLVKERSRSMGVDPAGLCWSALSACGAALDGSMRLELQPHFQVPPNIWVLLLAESGTGKSPIVKITWKPLERLQREAFDAWVVEKAEWDQLEKAERGPEPTFRKFVATDATIEGLQNVLSKQNRGIAVLRDEWAGFIGQLDKYTTGKGSFADRAFYLQAYDGRPYLVERVNSYRYVLNLLVTICGGIQPERLRKLGNLTDDGMLQRCAVIILRPLQTATEITAGREVAQYEALIQYLAAVPGERVVRLSPDAREVYHRVQKRIEQFSGNTSLGSGFRTSIQKLIGMWGRLALVIACVMHEAGLTLIEIDREPAEVAEHLIFDQVLKHAAHVYEWLGGGGEFETTQAIAAFLLSSQRGRVLASDLTTNVHACRGKSLKILQDMVSPLVAMGWLTPERDYNPNAWKVEQRIYNLFKERARQERFQRAQVRELLQGSDLRSANPENPGENEGGIYVQDHNDNKKHSPSDKIYMGQIHQDSQESDPTATSPSKTFQYRPRSYEMIERRMRQKETIND